MNVGDLSRSYQLAPATPALNQVSVTTKSAALDLGVKAVRFQLAFQSSAVTCTLNLYTTAAGVDTLVWSQANVGFGHADLYAGNLEFVDLAGAQIKIEVVNPTGGWVSVTVFPNN
jgi:hypothetical protein